MNSQLISAIRGPVLLIAVGVLFALDNAGSNPFSTTWPVLIIIFGAMKLIEHLVGRNAAPPPPPAGGLR